MRRGQCLLLIALLASALIIAERATAQEAEASSSGSGVDTGTSTAPDVEAVISEETPASSDPPPQDIQLPGGDAANAASAAGEAAGGKPKGPRSGAQKFEFQAEVSRLMDIIINSLYSNKDIFLRELISNAADALDKIRFLSLTDKAQLGDGDDAKLEIKISFDPEKKVLTIRDRGIGMTKEDLRNHLGTIAKSGTSAFLEQMQKGGDLNLIGQFGVGFYSVYLVADYVEVISKHNDDKQYIWESGADGAFAISEDTEGAPLGRGTQINIYLKEEAQEYVQEQKLRDLVSQYSEFINFPIYMYTSKQVEKDVPLTAQELELQETERAEKAAAKAQKADEDVSDEDEEADKEEEAPTTKMIWATEHDWEQLNTQNAIWLRNPADVTAEEYEKFYKAISKNVDTPQSHSHFKAEGDVEFRAVLFIPGTAPPDYMDNYYQKKNNIKLYVRRVFISDDFEDLMPRYLRWLVGLVDSDTLPLNVSREMLQAHSSLKTIKKKLVRKALDMIRKIADAQTAAEAEEKDEDGEKKDEEAIKKRETDKTAYTKLWNEFGKALKMGVVEDTANRNRLAKLLRVNTSKHPVNLTSLDDYIARMKPDQKDILYIAGRSRDEVENSPFLEKLKRKDYEVIYFTDALDEYVMSNLAEYDGHKFFDASKEDLKIGKDKSEKSAEKKLRGEYKELTKWWKDQLGREVQGVKVSKRLHDTPLVVVTSKFGWSANMERIMKAQAMGDSEKSAFMRGQKTLEINPHHPLIQELKTLHGSSPEGERTQLLARLLYETALLESGFQLDDNKAFNKRVYSLVKDALKIKTDFEKFEVPDEPAEEEEPEEAQAADTPEQVPGAADLTADAGAAAAEAAAEAGSADPIEPVEPDALEVEADADKATDATVGESAADDISDEL
jgi:heat shock protein beta